MSIKHGLLALLERGPMYGYQLRSAFEESTGGTWPLNIGQVYTTLGRLERDRFVHALPEQDGGQRSYEITDEGRTELALWFATPVNQADRPPHARQGATAVHALCGVDLSVSPGHACRASVAADCVKMSRFASNVRSLGHRRWFARIGRVLVPVDRALGRITKGRFVALGLRELPSMLLTTTGRRSGHLRTNPLLYARDGEAFVVIGSNWGQEHQPAWSSNLMANPGAVVIVEGQHIRVRATHATGAERDRLFELLLAIWPAYTTYQERAGEREIRVFRLDRAD